MSLERQPVSRRRVLSAAIGVAPAVALGTGGFAAAAAPSTSEAGTGTAVAAPNRRFTLYELQDPYAGQIAVPTTPPAGTRFVGADAAIDNSSDQALDFTPTEIRLSDESGVEYRGVSALGAEPSINERDLNGGERSRGWVWFTVDENAGFVEMSYVGPQPEFRIELTN